MLSFSCKVAVPVNVKVLALTAAPKVAVAPLATLPVNSLLAAVPIASKVALVVAEAINPPSPSLVACRSMRSRQLRQAPSLLRSIRSGPPPPVPAPPFHRAAEPHGSCCALPAAPEPRSGAADTKP